MFKSFHFNDTVKLSKQSQTCHANFNSFITFFFLFPKYFRFQHFEKEEQKWMFTLGWTGFLKRNQCLICIDMIVIGE